VAHITVKSESDGDDNLPQLTYEQLVKIGEKDMELRNQHIKIEATLSPEEFDETRRKRMIYRAKQRGWLEVDILLGTWAVENVPKLTPEECDEFEIVLKEETIDIYNFVSGKDPLPEHLEGLGVMKKLQSYAFGITTATPEEYAEIKEKNNLT
jgi:succinate dehydrogenase assembly factor 2